MCSCGYGALDAGRPSRVQKLKEHCKRQRGGSSVTVVNRGSVDHLLYEESNVDKYVRAEELD